LHTNIFFKNCNPETVCKKVCKRGFNGLIFAPIFSLKVKESKKATMTFTDVRKFSFYQVYNDFNKKLNCDRQVIVIKPENYNKALKEFNKRTCYVEFEPTPEIGKHCQIAFNLCSAVYNQTTNIITLEVLVDKFYIDGVLKPIQDINGIYCQCNLDFGICNNANPPCYNYPQIVDSLISPALHP
jgi:Fe-S-cluster containining protein